MNIFKIEEVIIDPLLALIKTNQAYLTKKENLPQLAKLGYIYNTLWYAGRICWGYGGILGKDDQCEDNPKYKIEACEPTTERRESLIYDAWSLHVGDDSPSWEEFRNTVTVGKQYSELELLQQKPNKTFDEWVTILTHPEFAYRSIFPNRRSVANYLLCVIGTGFGYQGGCVVKEAGGADQDQTLYGAWENCLFRKDIQDTVLGWLSLPEVETTVQRAHEYIKEEKRKRDEKRLGGRDLEELEEELRELLAKKGIDLDEERRKEQEIEDARYHTYYPIGKYSIITLLDKNSHPSYIQAGIDVCEDILAHREEESAGHSKGNVAFAEKFLNKFAQ